MAAGGRRQLQICNNNPSGTFGDSSLYTREPFLLQHLCQIYLGPGVLVGGAGF